jgi:hypothetical protein
VRYMRAWAELLEDELQPQPSHAGNHPSPFEAKTQPQPEILGVPAPLS